MRTRNADKEQLVKQNAIEMLVKEGFEGFSMNRLAKVCGISVATLYIYYKDKDDLIIKIATEEIRLMSRAMLDGFDPEASFEDGMRIQWKNRYEYMRQYPLMGPFMEQLRSSTYQQPVFETFMDEFKESMGRFSKNAIARGELKPLPLGVFWSIAYAPLYSLIRFNFEGRTVGGNPFKLTDKMLWQTFDMVMKALKP